MTNQPVKILLVDDDENDVLLTKAMLKDAKVIVDLAVAENGREGMAYLRKEGPHAESATPDLILLDLNMPVMDGREMLRIVKSDEKLKVIPVVIFTTSAADEEILKSYHLGANCYISKPVGLEALSKVVRHI